jgi:alkylglycerol monooxygenase
MNQYLIYVIPVLLFFVIFEMVADTITHKKFYKFEDAVTNISLGIGQQIIEALIKTVFTFLFLWVYKYSVFKIPDTIWTFGVAVLISDFIYYWFHRMSHTVNFLWAIHIVHHQSREFNLTVSLRQPWLNKIAAFAFYLPLPFFGISPTIMVLAFAFQTVYQFWLHTRFIGKIGFLENILVTPSHHRVHHGANEIYLNKNYGNTLIIWDKLFGTFQAEGEPVVFGTTRPFTSTNPIWANLYFWKEIIISAGSQKGFLRKSMIFFQRPADIPENKTEIAEKEYKSPSVPAWLNRYILVQCILILTAAFFFLFKQGSFSFLVKVGSVILIIWSIYNFSALMQRKRNSVLWEFVRIAIVCLTCTYLLTSAD